MKRQGAFYSAFLATTTLPLACTTAKCHCFLSSILDMFSGMDNSYGISNISTIGTGTVTVFYLFLAAIYFFLSLYLYRFSIRIKAAVHEHNSTLLENGLKDLKSYWKLIGILTAVVLGIYLFFFLISLLFGAAFASL